MPEPRPRSAAQIEASRRNGARSRGPITPEGDPIGVRTSRLGYEGKCEALVAMGAGSLDTPIPSMSVQWRTKFSPTPRPPWRAWAR